MFSLVKGEAGLRWSCLFVYILIRNKERITNANEMSTILSCIIFYARCLEIYVSNSLTCDVQKHTKHCKLIASYWHYFQNKLIFLFLSFHTIQIILIINEWVISIHFKRHLLVFYGTCFKCSVPSFSTVSRLLLSPVGCVVMALFSLFHPRLAWSRTSWLRHHKAGFQNS